MTGVPSLIDIPLASRFELETSEHAFLRLPLNELRLC